MKKILFLLLLPVMAVAQIPMPRSTTTFSNATLTGNLRVNGSTTLTGAATLSSSTTIGTGTVAANTSSLGIVRIKQGDSWLDIGERNSGTIGFWSAVTPSSTNYSMLFNSSETRINAPTSLGFYTGTTQRAVINAGGMALTGTFSASGASTLTGAAKQTNTLNYEGNTTWNTNQTNTLTTGNTGTVAVLSDAVFGIDCDVSSGNPSASTSYYAGNIQIGWSTTQGAGKIYVPYNCTLIGYTANYYITGTKASAESVTLAINVDNVATNLNTSMTFSLASGINTYTSSALSQNINAGSYIEAKTITPAWGTPPTSVVGGITFLFVRRQ